MSKRQKKTSQPNIAPAALLRLRLERLWHAPVSPPPTGEALEAGLQAASAGLKPETMVGVVLSVFAAAPPERQAALERWLPEWLARQNTLGTLEALAGKGQLPAALQPIALRWLAATGQAVATPSASTASTASTFHSAYALDDEYQAAVCVLWYSNLHRDRVRGFQFLIDYNPPWEGAIKELMALPSKPPQTLIRRFVAPIRGNGKSMAPVSGPEAKRKLLRALKANRAENIRLPAELSRVRDQFFEHIVSLPDLRDTPRITPDQFDALGRTGQSVEALRHFEQTVGRRFRLDNGQEAFMDASLINWALDELDDEEA